MQPKTLAALSFLLVAAVGAAWKLTRTDPHTQQVQSADPWPTIDKAAVDTLEITPPGEVAKISLTRTDGKWLLEQPVQDATDAEAVNTALEQLATARLDRRAAATSQDSWDKLQVGTDQSVTIAVSGSGAKLVTLHLGPTGYLRIGDAPEVYKVHGLRHSTFSRAPKMWRNRDIMQFDADSVASVGAAAGDTVVEVARSKHESDGRTRETFEISRGAKLVPTLDDTVPRQVIQYLKQLRADDFADGVDRTAAGLVPPRLAVTVTSEDRVTHTLLLGTETDKSVYVGLPDSDRVWLLNKSTADQFAKHPLQWRDKTIAELPAAEVRRIDLTTQHSKLRLERNGDGTWKAVQPSGLQLDDKKVSQLAGAMSHLRGLRIVQEAKSAKLTPPTVVATFHTATKKVSLTIGSTEDQLYYVRGSTRGEIFVIAEHTAQAFMKGASDLQQ